MGAMICSVGISRVTADYTQQAPFFFSISIKEAVSVEKGGGESSCDGVAFLTNGGRAPVMKGRARMM